MRHGRGIDRRKLPCINNGNTICGTKPEPPLLVPECTVGSCLNAGKPVSSGEGCYRTIGNMISVETSVRPYVHILTVCQQLFYVVREQPIVVGQFEIHRIILQDNKPAFGTYPNPAVRCLCNCPWLVFITHFNDPEFPLLRVVVRSVLCQPYTIL